MVVRFVELGSIGEKLDVVYFGAFRGQAVKNANNCPVRTRKREKGQEFRGTKF